MRSERGRCVFENVCHLVHFYHERRLPGGQIVGCADAGKELIDNADAGGRGRDEASHLRHEDNERDLAHIGRFTGHVGACDDGGLAAVCAENGIVRDKKRIFEHLLDHGVTALRDADLAGEVNLGAAVVVMDRRVRKAAKNV